MPPPTAIAKASKSAATRIVYAAQCHVAAGPNRNPFQSVEDHLRFVFAETGLVVRTPPVPAPADLTVHRHSRSTASHLSLAGQFKESAPVNVTRESDFVDPVIRRCELYNVCLPYTRLEGTGLIEHKLVPDADAKLRARALLQSLCPEADEVMDHTLEETELIPAGVNWRDPVPQRHDYTCKRQFISSPRRRKQNPVRRYLLYPIQLLFSRSHHRCLLTRVLFGVLFSPRHR